MKYLAFLFVAVVVGATIIANSGAGARWFRFVGYIPGKDITAHFLLYLGLGVTLTLYLPKSGWSFFQRHHVRLLLATGFTVAIEECSQAFISSRSFSLLDLTASLLGLLSGSLLASNWPYKKTQKSDQTNAIDFNHDHTD